MDILQDEAEQLLQYLPNTTADNQSFYETIHIKSSRTDYVSTSFEDCTLSDADLRSFVDCPPSQPDIISTRIVHMVYNSDVAIKSLPSTFRHVWSSFHLDWSMIYMVTSNVPGFLQLPPTSPDTTMTSFYLNCQAQWLLWTFDPSTREINAILLSRDSNGGRAGYPILHARLKRYSVLAAHPLYLAIVAALDRVTYVDGFMREQHRRIARVERHTGFSHFYINRPQPLVEDAEAELAHLSNLSRLASGVLVGIADMAQHLKSAATIFEVAMSGNNFGLAGGNATTTQGMDALVRRETEVENIARLLSPQLKQRFGYAEYIKERAENQLTVVTTH